MPTLFTYSGKAQLDTNEPSIVNAMGILLCRWLVLNINEIFCFERRHTVISWCRTECNVNCKLAKRQLCCPMMHIAHFYSQTLTWIMSKLLESASIHTSTSLHRSSLVFQTLSTSSVDFQFYHWAELWYFVLNENRGQCRVRSSRELFFASLCLLDYFDVGRKRAHH